MRKNHSKIVCIKLVHLPDLQFVYYENAVRKMRGFRADDGKYLSSVHV